MIVSTHLEANDSPSRSTPTRGLGFVSATAIVVGEVIGVGIFLTPAGMAKALGSPALLLTIWLATGASAIAGALCFGSLAARYPESGGGYVYLLRIYGPLPAFLYGWMSLLVIDGGIAAALASGFSSQMSYIFRLSSIEGRGVAVGVILALSIVNLLGARFGVNFVRALTILKIGALAFLALWGFGLGLGDWSHFVPFAARRADSPPLAAALVGGFIGAFFSFGGWWDLGKLTGETRDPERTIPRALVAGVSIITIIYITISAVFLYLVSITNVTSDKNFAAQAGEALFGRSGGVVFSLIVVVSVLGSLAAVLTTAPRVYVAMARDGLFFAAAGRVHPGTRAPFVAGGIQAIAASILVVSGSFDQILAYFIVPMLVFLGLIVAGVYVVKPNRDRAAGTRIPGYPVTPIVFLVPLAALFPLLLLDDPVRGLIGLGVVAAGIPAYYLMFRRSRTKLAIDPGTSV